MTNPFHWYWGYGQEPEIFYGACATREEALAKAKADKDALEEGFTVVEASKLSAKHNIFSADNIIEQYEEHNVECWDEDGSQINPDDEAKRELEALLEQALDTWMDLHDAHGHAIGFDEMRNDEYFAPEHIIQ